jgi:predicted lipoprotein with Yx(FWY)xxD motif
MRLIKLFVLAAVACAVAAGCSSSTSSRPAAAPAAAAATTTVPTTAAPATSGPTTSAATPTTSAPAAGARTTGFASLGAATASGLTVSLARGSQGIFLIGPNGHSLYVFDSDHGTSSACTAGCAPTWPGLAASGTVTTGPLVNKAQVGTANGQVPNQVTYYGHLLYYFAGDTAPGQTNGIGIPGWHLLGPVGNVMLPRG